MLDARPDHPVTIPGVHVSIIDKILRAGEGRTLRQLDRLASQVDALQEDFEALTDEELRGKRAPQ